MPIEAGARIDFLGVHYDPLDLPAALAWLAARRVGDSYAYVVTPNVDHVLRLSADRGNLRRIYEEADLCLCDSRVLSRLAARAGLRLPVAPGSDLTPALLRQVAQAGDRIAVVGGTPEEAVALDRLFPHLSFAHHHPPFGLAADPEGRRKVIAFLREHPARFVLLAVGSPQQELIAAEAKAAGGLTGTALCVGASVEFVLGVKRRAPGLVQQLSLEWAWRLMSEPRRMWRRYLVEAPRILPIAWRWTRARRR